VILDSLRAVFDLDYPKNRYELIVVDNGSTDGSFKTIKAFLDETRDVKIKLIRLERNVGFTGGTNIAYRARNPNSKYIMLLNNDAILFPESLQKLIDYTESRENIGAVQGVIVDFESGNIDTAGDIITEFLISYQLYHNRNPQSVKKSFYISYPDGANALLRVDAVKQATGFSDKIFYDEMFAYFDDSILGLQLWNKEFKVVSLPVLTAIHRRSSTFNQHSSLKLYLMTRGYFALNEFCNSRYKGLIRTHFSLRFLRTYIALSLAKFIGGRYRLALTSGEWLHAIYRGYIDGVRWGEKRVREIEMPMDIYKVPILRESFKSISRVFTGVGVDFLRRCYTEYMMRRFEREINKFIAE
jgi:GT2 family glycosyltransferase